MFVGKSGLPGSNGSDTRALVTGAGLILVLAGNFLQASAAPASIFHPRKGPLLGLLHTSCVHQPRTSAVAVGG